MSDFAPFETNFKKIQRRQALRFGLPVLMFSLLVAVFVAAVVYAQREERDQNRDKLIADTLWARQNIQFQLDGLSKSMGSLVQDPLIYYSDRFRTVSTQLFRSHRELQAVYRDLSLELISHSSGNMDEVEARAIAGKVLPLVEQRARSRLNGFVGPVVWNGRNYLALVNVGSEERAVVVGLIDLNLMLDNELPWWFARDHEVDVLDTSGTVQASLKKGKEGQGVYVHLTSLELPGTSLQLRVNSGEAGPRIFNYAVTASILFLMLLLLLSFGMLWRDSRKRLTIEAKLEEEKLFRQSMQDSIALGMRVWDLSGTIRFVNPAFCNMVGFDAEELVGRPMPMPYWPVNYSEEYRRLVAKVLAGNTPPKGFESVYQHKDGRLIDVLIVEAPLKDSKGLHVGWMSSVLDITDRKKSEALISEQREKLQSASRFALVGEVASNIAHELNQPLATMVSFAQAGVNLSKKGVSLERYAEMFEKIRDQAQRASRVVGSVQNLVRKRRANRESVTPHQMIESIRPILDSIIQKHEVNFHIELDHAEQILHLDRIMVEQALVNLIKNSAEAFRASQKIRNVWLRTRSTEDNYQFEVRDDGPGVSLDNTEKMFEALVSTKADGLGLGLSLCRSVAEAHGGRLRAESLPTGGTLFIIDLPMAVQDTKEEYAGQ